MSADIDVASAKARVLQLAAEVGFRGCGIASIELAEDEQHLLQWLESGFHGQMDYMQRHGVRRSRPAQLLPGTLSVVSVRMDYWPAAARDAADVLQSQELAYVSRYALGRDYHKVMRSALARLSAAIVREFGQFGYRVCVDSAPVLEKALARNAGLGWIGKHTNLLARDAGSLFFLGEILTDLPLPPDGPVAAHCGTCSACIEVCPTQAIVAPWRLDARRCISYLTIENPGPIPQEFRAALGNRIYGCDDCQLVCPWNKYARTAAHPDFKVRQALDAPRLTDLFRWTAAQWDERMRGSAIYRIGYERWSRNIAVALGNAAPTDEIMQALQARAADASALVREHVQWALGQQSMRRSGARDA